jgi:hypothetical protein
MLTNRCLASKYPKALALGLSAGKDTGLML